MNTARWRRYFLLFFDPKSGPTFLGWALVGALLAVIGLSLLAVDLSAWLEGVRRVRTSHRPGSSPTIAIEARLLVGLVFATAGLGTVWRGVTLARPDLGSRWWMRLALWLLVAPLVFLMFALGAVLLAARIF